MTMPRRTRHHTVVPAGDNRHEQRDARRPGDAWQADPERVMVAIPTGLVLRVEPVDPGSSYDVRLMAVADDGAPVDLAARRIPAATAAEALDRMISAEHDSGGIETEEARRFHDQVTRTVAAARADPDHLATSRPDRHPAWNADVTPEARWRDTVTAVAGAAVTADARWPALAAALDRAVAAGWDWATELPQITSSPLPERAAANELYYRLLDAHPATALTPSATSGGDHGTPPPGPSAPTHRHPPTPAPAVTADRGSPGRLTPHTKGHTTMTAETVTTVIGNLTADPEIKYTQSGAAVTSFTIASTPRRYDRTSGQWTDGDTLFIRCSQWRRAAEHAAESLQRGMRVIAYGALQQRSFEGRDGAKRTVIELAVEEVGPSLRYASARVTQLDRSSQPAGAEQDVWASRRDTEPAQAN